MDKSLKFAEQKKFSWTGNLNWVANNSTRINSAQHQINSAAEKLMKLETSSSFLLCHWPTLKALQPQFIHWLCHNLHLQWNSTPKNWRNDFSRPPVTGMKQEKRLAGTSQPTREMISSTELKFFFCINHRFLDELKGIITLCNANSWHFNSHFGFFFVHVSFTQGRIFMILFFSFSYLSASTAHPCFTQTSAFRLSFSLLFFSFFLLPCLTLDIFSGHGEDSPTSSNFLFISSQP